MRVIIGLSHAMRKLATWWVLAVTGGVFVVFAVAFFATPLPFSIAHRVLGSVSATEDAVQKTRPRFDGSATRPEPASAFPSATATRVSIDALRSTRVPREADVGPRIPARC